MKSYALGEIPSLSDRITIVRQLWDLTQDVLSAEETGTPIANMECLHFMERTIGKVKCVAQTTKRLNQVYNTRIYELVKAQRQMGETVVVNWDGYTIGYYGRIFEARNKTKGGSFEGDDKEIFKFKLGSQHWTIPLRDSFPRFDSMHGANELSSLPRFDSMRSTIDALSFGSMSRFDSMQSRADHPPLGSHARFDSIRSSISEYGGGSYDHLMVPTHLARLDHSSPQKAISKTK